jgi:hypothetical protein
MIRYYFRIRRLAHTAALTGFILAVSCAGERANAAGVSPDDAAFFNDRVLPILRSRCFECHSHDAEISGGLALDVKSGWEQGGQSGPAVVPGKPDESLLVAAVRHAKADYEMPPDGPKLPDDEIATLVAWVARGAPDPRQVTAADAWEKTYAERMKWWSLAPLGQPTVPEVRDAAWPRNDIDRFILAKLESAGLKPAEEASPATLARRLSLVLTGLPPDPGLVEAFAADPSPAAYDRLVESLLASPHYGEHQARHWMDVVHYSDTHGYEWDVPTKNAWMYRDYLVRAFNADIPFERLVLEQIAGDLIEPRVDPATGLNEAIIGPMALRMGERRHGDSAFVENVTQENVADMIDTVTKAFLGSTVGCARCHDHKLDAISQADYYSLAGVFTSTRWSPRSADTTDPNATVIDELRGVKQRIHASLASRWLADRPSLFEKIRSQPIDEKDAGFPESLGAWQARPADRQPTAEEFAAEQRRRTEHNREHLRLVADFTSDDPAAAGGWRWEGFGMQHGLVADGDFVVPDRGDAAVLHLLPAGRWSHAFSTRLAGAVRSPELFSRAARTISVGMGSGLKASRGLLVDRAFHSERLEHADIAPGAWATFTVGNFSRLSGSPDTRDRTVSLEITTKALDNYFPPRYGFGANDAEIADPRSWFGVTKVYEHPAEHAPRADLRRLEPLFKGGDGWRGDRDKLAERIADVVLDAVRRWQKGDCDADDVATINEALRRSWLDATALSDPETAAAVALYRAAEKRLVPDRTIGSMEEWGEGRDARIEIRGVPTDLGDAVPRGTIRFLRDALENPPRPEGGASGRLELARSITDPRNPLTARVFVNRIWLHLFGEGLVRTPDDFGRLGEPPLHAELLDHLARRFVEEGWSTKKLVREIVHSVTWRMSSGSRPENVAKDPENRLWHHHPRRRLEAESIRDSILAVSGRLDRSVGGPPIDPHRSPKKNPERRLMSGPLDGHGRRSLYVKMTLMEPPRFLALFNQPMPRVTVGKRDRTTVPEQALAILNDPFVIAMAGVWGERMARETPTSLADGATTMLATALGRPPKPEEVARLSSLAIECGSARGIAAEATASSAVVWQDVAHAIFTMQEFIHVE